MKNQTRPISEFDRIFSTAENLALANFVPDPLSETMDKSIGIAIPTLLPRTAILEVSQDFHVQFFDSPAPFITYWVGPKIPQAETISAKLVSKFVELADRHTNSIVTLCFSGIVIEGQNIYPVFNRSFDFHDFEKLRLTLDTDFDDADYMRGIFSGLENQYLVLFHGLSEATKSTEYRLQGMVVQQDGEVPVKYEIDAGHLVPTFISTELPLDQELLKYLGYMNRSVTHGYYDFSNALEKLRSFPDPVNDYH